MLPGPEENGDISTPEQNSIPLDPVEQLTTHGDDSYYADVFSQKRVLRILRVALGEQQPALASALVPLWVMEGNAVLAESALTPGGRGRAPILPEADESNSYTKGRRCTATITCFSGHSGTIYRIITSMVTRWPPGICKLGAEVME